MSIKEEEWRPSVRGLDLLYLDGTLGSTKCMEAYERHLNALDDLARAKYLFGQHERLEIIKKERKEHQIEKEKNCHFLLMELFLNLMMSNMGLL